MEQGLALLIVDGLGELDVGELHLVDVEGGLENAHGGGGGQHVDGGAKVVPEEGPLDREAEHDLDAHRCGGVTRETAVLRTHTDMGSYKKREHIQRDEPRR